MFALSAHAMEYYFSILELNPGASETEIKKAYRRLARKYHPDVSRLPDAEEKFLEITHAYERLLEKPSYQAISFESQIPVVDHQQLRRERARHHARMQYEQFRRSTLAFKKAWYFTPLKILTTLLVSGLYMLAAGMLASPIVAWIVSGRLAVIIGFALLATVSAQVFQVARLLHKGTRDYFENWE